MSKLSRILRWAALPLALSMTATLAQATIPKQYAGNPTSLGTLSETAPTLSVSPSMTIGSLRFPADQRAVPVAP
jgi:hypothetical protein